MSTSKQDTAIALRRMANLVKGVLQTADDIEAIGSIENATAEAIAARDKAMQERDEAMKAHADIQAKCQALIKESKDAANKLLADAERDATALAAELLANAETQNKANTEAAMKLAATTMDAANSAAAKAAAERDSLMTQSAALAAEVAEQEAKLKTAQAEHDKLTKAVDKIKSQFKIE